MLVIKCDNCNEIFDLIIKYQVKDNKIAEYYECPYCNFKVYERIGMIKWDK